MIRVFPAAHPSGLIHSLPLTQPADLPVYLDGFPPRRIPVPVGRSHDLRFLFEGGAGETVQADFGH
jgi:hypothetical protein